MKKIISILLVIAGISSFATSCKKEPNAKPVQITIQLFCDGTQFQTEGVKVTLTDASATSSYEEVTDASGIATFVVPVGAYTAAAVHKEAIDGERIVYNGQNANIMVSNGLTEPFELYLNKVVSQQLIIKELYYSGCPTNDNAGSYASDQYVIIYNNSSDPADASNLIFAHAMPYMASTANAYYQESGQLLYENLDWMPAGSGLWWFTNPVTIEPYSQIVVVFKQAINHTTEVSASVDLSDPSYYWMDNSGIPEYANNKGYMVTDAMPSTHYLTGQPFADTRGGWSLGTSEPAFYIGKMPADQARAICLDEEGHIDQTLSTFKGMWVLKFPKECFVDGIELFATANVDKSQVRFPADVNTGYLAMTGKLGYSAYRNVDKEATEALPENEGKLVYGYAGGTGNEEEGTLSTDPSGIDAEASIKNGAHIIYSETNNTAIDFHQRATASLRKN